MKNEKFNIEIVNGGIESLIIANDEYKMNWVNSANFNFKWGQLYFKSRTSRLWFKEDQFQIKKVINEDDYSETVYETRCLRCTVKRRFTETGDLREEYIFKNISKSDVFTKTGEIGIYVPFSDNYCEALKSQKENCNTHIWCGENMTWVNALRQGLSGKNLGLVLLEGSIDKYSVANKEENVNGYSERGAFILHPEAMELLPDEERTVAWEVFTHSGTDEFKKIVSQRQSIADISAKFYTVFEGENIEFSFKTKARRVAVLLDGKEVPYTKSDDKYLIEYTPCKFGEHKFVIIADGEKTHTCFFATKKKEDLIFDRINFIVDNQQYHREGSALNGAYLVYDNKEDTYIFDDRFEWVDINASRERLAMPLVIARYLQMHENQKFYDSLMKAVEFLKRECVDMETGEVFNTIGKNRAMVRLYNAPWMILLFSELYILEGKAEYMEFVHKAVKYFYSNGGLNFYPNGIRPSRVMYAFEKYGKKEYAAEAMEYFKQHADNMIKKGLDYPRHEVIFEQTIVTPAATIIGDMAALTNDKKYAEAAKKHFDVLERFDGMQPDYRLNQIAIRYWDDYWFGKTQIAGDTLPHYWSCLSAASYKLYYDLTNDEKYKKAADMCIRNCMCLFDKEGKGSCAYMYPFRIDDIPGEFYDEWANDQDFALYSFMDMNCM